MKKALKRRSGFTLVELLIVIIIIGILAGAMLLVAGAGTDKAEATKVVSNLRSMKAASLLYYADHNAFPGSTNGNTDWSASMDPYMDRKLNNTNHKWVNNSVEGVFVGYVDSVKITTGVQAKLAEMAEPDGLYDAAVSTDVAYATGPDVWMRVK